MTKGKECDEVVLIREDLLKIINVSRGGGGGDVGKRYVHRDYFQ